MPARHLEPLPTSSLAAFNLGWYGVGFWTECQQLWAPYLISAKSEVFEFYIEKLNESVIRLVAQMPSPLYQEFKDTLTALMQAPQAIAVQYNSLLRDECYPLLDRFVPGLSEVKRLWTLSSLALDSDSAENLWFEVGRTLGYFLLRFDEAIVTREPVYSGLELPYPNFAEMRQNLSQIVSRVDSPKTAIWRTVLDGLQDSNQTPSVSEVRQGLLEKLGLPYWVNWDYSNVQLDRRFAERLAELVQESLKENFDVRPFSIEPNPGRINDSLRPVWDEGHGVLRLSDLVVYEPRMQSNGHAATVLGAFENQAWKSQINNPILEKKKQNNQRLDQIDIDSANQALRSFVKNLKKHVNDFINFEAIFGGSQCRWKLGPKAGRSDPR